MEILEPYKQDELLRGWLLHAHKGRDRHDSAARSLDWQRYLVGIPATIFSAIVGTTTFIALQKSDAGTSTFVALHREEIAMAVGAVAIIAAILTSLQSFLDLGARAERHRIAGVKYKEVIRQSSGEFKRFPI